MHIYATIEPYLILSIQNKLDKLPNKRGIKTNSTKIEYDHMKSYSRENLSQKHFIFKFSKGPLLSIVLCE